MKRGFPRVLVVSPEPFNRERGCGITLMNLFAGWPAERLACIHLTDAMWPDSSVCHQHLSLARFSQNGAKPNTKTPSFIGRLAKSMQRVFLSLGKQFARKIGIRPWLLLFQRISIGTDQWVADFAPQVVYCPINSPAMLCLFQQLIEGSSIPAVVHVYDDWIAVAGDTGVIAGVLFRMELDRRLRGAFARASVCMAIGDEMARQYHRRYGHEFLSFQNPPSANVWLASGRNNWVPGTPFRFRFLGNMYEDGNVQALKTFAEMVEAVEVGGVHVMFDVFTTLEGIQRYGPLFAGYPHTTFHRVLETVEEMAILHGTADALVLAYNTDACSRRAFGLSMPTKLPTSLLSGTPIIVYASAESAVAKMICGEDCGFYLSPEEPMEVAAVQLANFIADAEARERWGKRGRVIARRFTGDVVRPAFQNVLIEAADYSKGKPHGD